MTFDVCFDVLWLFFKSQKQTFIFRTCLLTFVFTTKVTTKTNFDNTWIFDELGEFHITFQSSLKRSNRHFSIFTICHFEETNAVWLTYVRNNELYDIIHVVTLQLKENLWKNWGFEILYVNNIYHNKYNTS